MKKDSRKISELRNLGITSHEDFEAVGITRAEQLLKLDPKKAFVKMLEGRRKRGKSIKCCNASYLYAIYGAMHNLDWRLIPENKKKEFKDFTLHLRKTGLF